MNRLTLAVAGGRKTQSLVDQCVAAAAGRRVLVLTYTQANQAELRARLATHGPLDAQVHVQGWFSFLLDHWVRPYVPRRFDGARLRGLNFQGDPGRYAKDCRRFLDEEGRAYKRHLAQLALDTNSASSNAVLDRLSRIYDDIYIDEVQDLNGYDLEILDALIASPIDLTMVGDVRQAIILTNPEDLKNKQFKGIAIKRWFEDRERKGELDIEHSATTWRCNQLIADFADRIFDQSWGFPPTTSENVETTGHDGVFAVREQDVYRYVTRYRPLCLRHSSASARSLTLPFTTFGLAKGLGVDRVLIAPTGPIAHFVRSRRLLSETSACGLYVAVTRARSSVVFVCPTGHELDLPVWTE